MSMQCCFKDHREFLKHPEWKVYAKSKDDTTKLYTRVSNKQLFCVKSVSVAREHLNDIVAALCDNNLKTRYDESFDSGQLLYQDLPFEGSVSHLKFKKVLVVSPRDLVVIGKIHRLSESDVYIFGKSFKLDSHPPFKNIVRAESSMSGWHVKVI